MATWPGKSGRYAAAPEAQRDRVPVRHSVGAYPTPREKKPRTLTESMRHNVAKFFGVADDDDEKRERTRLKWQASTRRMQARSLVMSHGSGSHSKTRPQTATEYELTQRRSQYMPVVVEPETEVAAQQQLLTATRPESQMDTTDASGSMSVSSSMHRQSVPPHPLDPRAPPLETEYSMLTLQPSKRMERQCRKALTLKHDNIWKMAVDGVNSLSLRRPRPATISRARSIKPGAIFNADRDPVMLDIGFFDDPMPTSTLSRNATGLHTDGGRGDGDTVDSSSLWSTGRRARYMSYRTTKNGLKVPDRPTQPQVLRSRGRRPSADEVEPDGRRKGENAMTYIGREFIEEFIDNTNRHEFGIGLLGQCLGLQRKSKLDSNVQHELDAIGAHPYRPYFTYWVTFVQLVCFIVSVAVFGIATIGGAMTEIKGEVLTSSLSIEKVVYREDSNFWIGPRQADLIHLGAKYSPCMRDDDNVRNAIISDRDEERNSSCCILNDGSGCVQTSAAKCSNSLAEWNKWTPESPGPDGRISGSVCHQDPQFCTKPQSVGAFEWPDDITQWPICEETENGTTKKHMTCPIAGRPCCIGVQGQCVITTREYCEFRRGYFHEEAALCSQVACMSEICGMIPFHNPAKPDQFYRLWTSLFIHAGILQLLLTIIFQLLFMRDMEKLLGWLRICLLYILSGIAGSLGSAIFIPYHVEAGPSGSLFGILACFFIEIITNYDTYEPSSLRWAVGWLSGVTVFLFIAGLLPMIDNYAHLIGFDFGLLLGFALMPFAGRNKKCRVVGVVVCLVVACGLLATLIVLFYVAPIYTCPGCQYFNCIPLTPTFCRSSEVKITRDTEGY